MTDQAVLSSGTPDVSNSSAVGASIAEGSSPSQPSSGSAPSEPVAGDVTAPVQGQVEQPQTPDDPLAGLPSLEELQQQAEQNVPGAKGLAQLRSAYEALKPQFTELQTKFQPFEPIQNCV